MTLPLLAAAIAIPGGSAGAADGRDPILGTKPAWAIDSALAATTKADSAEQIDARVWLAGRDPRGMTNYARAVSDPASPLYRQFLTPARFNQRFGPTARQIGAVTSWLKSAGLTVTEQNNHYVRVRGTAATAAKAFGVDFDHYKVAGKVERAPRADASVPSSVSSSVLTVTGLDSRKTLRRPAEALPPPDPNFWVAEPCAKYYGQKVATGRPAAFGRHQPYAMCGLVPRQLRGAYGVTGSGLTGKGVTVAITDAYALPTMEKDANTYALRHGEQPFRPGQYREVLPDSFDHVDECGAAGWYGEQALDVESVHAMAPDADIVYVAGRNCVDGLDEALIKIVDNRLADIVSNSWGDLTEHYTTALIKAEEQIFKQGAIEGIGFYFSSGDCGYEAPGTPCQDRYGDFPSHGRQVDLPTSDPWVTSVGGTTLAVGARNNYLFETGWGQLNVDLSADGRTWSPAPPGPYPGGYVAGAGGGTSTLFRQPFYQRGTVPRSLSTALPDGTRSGRPMRVVPDIGALADPTTGFRFGMTSQLPDGSFGFAESRIGGTSLACPMIAGIQALAQQAQGGVPIGFANPAIYLRAGGRLYHDVTDHPLGRTQVAFVRADYTDPFARRGPNVYHLRTEGVNGVGADALRATPGYDHVTGVGTPTRRYLESHR
ncbi:MAG TPA: S53 family peptidase [Streptosporangiaceae bacterium]|nr:S53 family peptidase [Streptosporangiaceae bacterium]